MYSLHLAIPERNCRIKANTICSERRFPLSLPTMRSISSIISTLKTSFRDADFAEAESELKSMELKLRSDYELSESQRSDLMLQNLRLEEENRRIQREFEISDRRVSELGRELSVVKERERKGIERYERLMKEFRVLEDEKEKISEQLCEKNEEIGELRGVGRGRDEVDERIRVLEREKSELEVELDGLWRVNEGLVAARARADEEMEKMRRDLEEENKGFRADLRVKYEEICELKAVERKNEGEIKELFERNEVLEGKLERVKKKVVALEMEKRDIQAKFDELRRENERVVADVKEKDERAEELKRKVEGLEFDKCVIVKEKEEESRKYDEVEERLLKVEEDVANWLLENVPIAKKVMGDQVAKVISGVLNALGSEQDGWTDRADDIVGRDSVASRLNEAEVNAPSSLETKVLSDTEVQRVNGTIGVKRDVSLGVVVLSDSDCDIEDQTPLSKLKRPRVLSQCSNKCAKLENCSQNSSCKFKQPMYLPSEDSDCKPLIAATHRSDKFVTSKKHDVAPFRQCNETSGDKVKQPISCGLVDDVSCQHNDLRNPLANVFCSSECNVTSDDKVKKLISACRQKLWSRSSKGFCTG